VVEQAMELTTKSAFGLLWWALGAFVLALVVMFFVMSRRRHHNA
jgi:hypothetical protein